MIQCQCGRDIPDGVADRLIDGDLRVARCTSCNFEVDAQYVSRSRGPLVEQREVTTPTSLESIGAVGVLDGADLSDLNAGSRRVADLLADGRWHRPDEIRVAAGNGAPASEGLRRARELRNVPGVILERRRVPETRLFEYRLRRLRIDEVMPMEDLP